MTAAQTARWPEHSSRMGIQTRVGELLSRTVEGLSNRPVVNHISPEEIREELRNFDFHKPMEIGEAAERVVGLLTGGMVHMMHPGYFGLFNPSVLFPGIVADLITASLNPQLAVWSHAPVPVEIERYTIDAIGELCGWEPEVTAGHFTTGGAEANYTAVLMALTRASATYSEIGARAFTGQPRLYVSAESHLAWLQIAHQAGIGREAVQLIATDGGGRMNPAFLAAAIDADRTAGDVPVFVAATAGTTNAGMIDPLEDCEAIARAKGLWFHVDAAWGGAGLMSPRSAVHLKGVEKADSITFDAHKWFAVPMGAGMFLCRDNALLGETFRVSASYMPESTEATIDPYTHSMQWSRRFIGLKLFLTLACIGWDGYRDHVEHALEMSDRLSKHLTAHGWRVVNDSALAVVCFVDDHESTDLAQIAADVVSDGRAWISAAKFEERTVLRACMTSHFTRDEHLHGLIDALNQARTAQVAQ